MQGQIGVNLHRPTDEWQGCEPVAECEGYVNYASGREHSQIRKVIARRGHGDPLEQKSLKRGPPTATSRWHESEDKNNIPTKEHGSNHVH